MVDSRNGIGRVGDAPPHCVVSEHEDGRRIHAQTHGGGGAYQRDTGADERALSGQSWTV